MKNIFMLLIVISISFAYTVNIDRETNTATLNSQYGNITLMPFKTTYPAFLEEPPTMKYNMEFCAYADPVTIYSFCGIFNETISGDAGIWKSEPVTTIHSFTCDGDQYGKINNTEYWCYQNDTNHTIYTTEASWVNAQQKTVYWNVTHMNEYWQSLKQYVSHEQIGQNHVYCFNRETTIQANTCKELSYSVKPASKEGKWDYYIDTSVGQLLIDPEWGEATATLCQQINITNSFPANYSHNITLNSSWINYSNFESNGEDLRFYEGTDCDNANTTLGRLGHWTQEWNSSGDSYVIVKTDTADAPYLLMYHKITGASDLSDFESAYILADDFNGNDADDINTSKWTENAWVTTGAGTSDAAIYSNVLRITSSPSGGWRTHAIFSDMNFSTDSAWILTFDGYRNTENRYGFVIFGNNSVPSSGDWVGTTPWIDTRTATYTGANSDFEYNNGGGVVGISVVSYGGNGWDNQQLIYDYPNNSTKRYFNGALAGSSTIDGFDTTDDFAIRIQTTGDLGTHYKEFDNVSISPYVATLPTYAIGAEESVPSTDISECKTIDASGTYNITANLTSELTQCIQIDVPNVTINGQGYSITGNQSTDTYAIQVWSASGNVTIENLTVSNYKHGIYVHETDNVTLRNITSFDNYDTGIYAYQLSNLTIDNCTSYNNTLFGIVIDQSNETLVTNSIVHNQSDTAFYYKTSYDSIIENNTAYDAAFAITLNLNSSISKINNNTFYDIVTYGIYIAPNSTLINITTNTGYNVSDTAIYTYISEANTIHNNLVYNNTYGIGIDTATNNTNVTNNTVYDNIQTGIWIGANSSILHNSNITVANNSVYNNTDRGILFWNTINGYLGSHTLDYNEVELSNATVYVLENVTCTNTNCFEIITNDVLLDGNNHTITGTTSGNYYGIYSDGHSNITINNVYITDFNGSIWLQNTTNSTITNVTATGAHNTSCIGIYGGSDSIEISNLLIYECADNGIRLSNMYSIPNINNITITNVTIYGCMDGIDIYGHNVTIQNSTFGNNAFASIAPLQNSSFATIRYNTFNGTYGGSYSWGDISTWGIHTVDSHNTSIYNNTFLNSGASNIYIESSEDVNISNNTVYNSGLDGENSDSALDILNSDNVLVINDHYYNNSLADIKIRSTSVTGLIELSGVIIDNSAGDYENFTNLSLTDTTGSLEQYTINWSAGTTLPSEKKSVKNKYLQFATQTGIPEITSVTIHWKNENVSDYTTSEFQLYQYDSAWAQYAWTLDTTNSQITTYLMTDLVLMALLEDEPEAASSSSSSSSSSSPPPEEPQPPSEEQQPTQEPTNDYPDSETNPEFYLNPYSTHGQSVIADAIVDISNGELGQLPYQCTGFFEQRFRFAFFEVFDRLICEWKGLMSLYLTKIGGFINSAMVFLLFFIMVLNKTEKKQKWQKYILLMLIIVSFILSFQFLVFALTALLLIIGGVDLNV